MPKHRFLYRHTSSLYSQISQHAAAITARRNTTHLNTTHKSTTHHHQSLNTKRSMKRAHHTITSRMIRRTTPATIPDFQVFNLTNTSLYTQAFHHEHSNVTSSQNHNENTVDQAASPSHSNDTLANTYSPRSPKFT